MIEAPNESRFEGALDALQNTMKYFKKVNNYETYCRDKLAECDKYLSDLDHQLELNKLDGIKMVKLSSDRKKVLIYRRFYKDELLYIDCLKETISDTNKLYDELSAISKKISAKQTELNNRVYIPRVLFDGWNTDAEELKKQSQARDESKAQKELNKKIHNQTKKYHNYKRA